ncbi:hypothetical protein [Sphingosinicella microcystinivorans]|uniref:hypothetical protein n=1 Tax=Sphingosinicella microcystinivorans TaxID=335406 RepID=UPI0022F39868|nr:hypothetical protein [Sphingosinicella microcystinivorans]WBX85294.1 hypothetical protein PE061_05065 [Sphingosinicella microcystinivorans]
MKIAIPATCFALLFSATSLQAQDAKPEDVQVQETVQASSPEPEVQAPEQPPVSRELPASTQVQITSDSEISSKAIEVGNKFNFTVVNDVVEGGAVAIPRGSKVEATVTWKTGKAVGGKSGKFELNFDKINVRGVDYPMRGTHRQEGKGNTVAAVFATWLVSGRSAVMLPGQMVTAFTDRPIPY